MYCIISSITTVLEEPPHLPTSFSGGPLASLLAERIHSEHLGSPRVGPGTLTPLQSLKQSFLKDAGICWECIVEKLSQGKQSEHESMGSRGAPRGCNWQRNFGDRFVNVPGLFWARPHRLIAFV